MAVILGLHGGHLDHLPHVTLTLLVPHQHTQQLAYVPPIALGAPPPAGDRNGGGIHHVVGDPVPLQKPMEPETFTPRFIATDDGCRFWETQAAFRLGDFVEYALLLPCGYGTLAWLLPMASGEAELPSLFTQFKGHKQRGCGGGTLLIVGRCSGHGLSPPW
jgi:hypothetical protein